MNRWMLKQKGVTQVEFTLISLAVLLMIFSIIEFALYFYSIQMTNEVTRRAARLATVCYIADKKDIPNLQALKGLYPPGFSTTDLRISYLSESGQKIDSQEIDLFVDEPNNTAAHNVTFSKIRYVKAEVDYTFQFFVLSWLIDAVGVSPNFETILPAESLGVLRPEKFIDSEGVEEVIVREDC